MFLRPQKTELIKEVNSQRRGKLLEVGIGNGKHLSLYREHDITGIDSSAAMLAIAGKHANAETRLILMDGENLLFPNASFDYVVLSHVLAVVDCPDRLLHEIHRVLKPTGRVFILNHFTPGNPLRFLDYAFHPLSRMFRFRSVFYIEQLAAIKKFSLVKTKSFRFSYFKLLIFKKG